MSCRFARPLDVVVIAYNNLDLTARAVVSVLYSEPQARVILVDNGSKAEDLSVLRPLLEARGHLYIRREDNGGPYVAANAGIAHVKTAQFVVLCNDAAVFPGSLRRMAASLSDKMPYLAAREVQDVRFDPAFLSAAPEIAHPTAAPQLLGSPGVFFTCFAVNKDFFDQVGPFDERFRLTFGDTDWEQRANDILNKSGQSLTQTETIVVFHGGSVTRKRLGVEADLKVDVGDHVSFMDKWKDRQDVLTKHPREDVNGKREFLKREWPTFGET
jgi:GT2 family glycosyltransferase